LEAEAMTDAEIREKRERATWEGISDDMKISQYRADVPALCDALVEARKALRNIILQAHPPNGSGIDPRELPFLMENIARRALGCES
jgi:hypothetical protein